MGITVYYRLDQYIECIIHYMLKSCIRTEACKSTHSSFIHAVELRVSTSSAEQCFLSLCTDMILVMPFPCCPLTPGIAEIRSQYLTRQNPRNMQFSFDMEEYDDSISFQVCLFVPFVLCDSAVIFCPTLLYTSSVF